MSHLLLDTRLLRVRRWFLGEPEDLMQLAEEITSSAFYVCEKNPWRICGTAFLLALLGENILEDAGSCVVTAAHVIEGIKSRGKRDAWLLMNPVEGDRIPIRVPLKNWLFHPTDRRIDVAVVDWDSVAEGQTVDHSMILSQMALTQKDHVEHGIREGGTVFCVGVFTKHAGRMRVIPIFRTGNIALMPDAQEPIYTDRGPMEGYLVECRSVGGLSGSPVFSAIDKIVPPIIPTPPGYIPAEQYKAEIRALWAWMGLMHGHWKIDKKTLATMDMATDDKKEPLNTGIAIVVPAWKVMEVVNHPRLVEMRKQRIGRHRAKNTPVEDSSGSTLIQETNAPKPDDRITIPVPSRGQFVRDLTKATRKRKPSS